MLTKLKSIYFLIICCSVLFFSQKITFASEGTLKIVATQTLFADIVKQIGIDKVEVKYIGIEKIVRLKIFSFQIKSPKPIATAIVIQT